MNYNDNTDWLNPDDSYLDMDLNCDAYGIRQVNSGLMDGHYELIMEDGNKLSLEVLV